MLKFKFSAWLALAAATALLTPQVSEAQRRMGWGGGWGPSWGNNWGWGNYYSPGYGLGYGGYGYPYRGTYYGGYGWGGYEKGWEAVSKRWDWAGQQFKGGTVSYRNLTSVATAELAYTTDIETFCVRMDGIDQPVQWSNRVTHIFRHANEWRLVHRHANRLQERYEPARVLKERQEQG